MTSYARNFRAVIVFCLTVLLILSVTLLLPADVAYAALPDSYTDYLSDLPSDADWYYGEDYLNLDAVKTTIDVWKADENFDWEALAADPIVIAVIDSGIGHAYKTVGGEEIAAPKTDYYKTEGLTYSVNPIFDDVILKDNDGDYVFKTTVDANKIKNGASVTRDYSIFDMAYVLADNTSDNHGTHVTGTIALLIHALELEDYVKILPIKANDNVNSSGHAGYDYDKVEEAVEFAVDCEADIISMSLTANSAGFSFKNYYQDTVFVAAAGNDGSALTAGYPAADEGVIGVMNVTKSDDGAIVSSKSNYGSKYDLAAPGTDIISTIDGKDGYGKLSGTSMATPIVSFAAALLQIRYRGIQLDTGIEITPALTKAILRAGTYETVDIKAMPLLNLLSLVQADYLYDEEYEGSIYVRPEGIGVTSYSPAELTLGEDKEVSVRVKYQPTNSKTEDNVVWWYTDGVNTVNLGEGEKISFAQPDKVGTYAVYCKLVDTVTNTDTFVCSAEDAFVFTVKYHVLNDRNSAVLYNGNEYSAFTIKIGAERIFEIEGIEYTDATKTNVIWYVNGLAVGNNKSFNFSSDTPGEYVITAEVNGIKIGNDLTITVKQVVVEGLLPSQIAMIALCSVVVFLTVAALLYKIIRAKSAAKAFQIKDED